MLDFLWRALCVINKLCVEQWVAGQATYFTSLGSDAVGAYRYTHKKGYLLAENLGGLKWKHLLLWNFKAEYVRFRVCFIGW